MLIVIILLLPIAVEGSVCYPVQSDFQNLCTNVYGGVVDGGRCFYAIPKPGDWDMSWAACRANGSVLAQIHTQREWDAVHNYIIAINQNNTYRTEDRDISMAMRDDQTTLPPCGLTPTTYWFDDETTPNLKLPALSVYGKWRECDDNGTVISPRCLKMEWNDRQCDSTAEFPLCVFSNDVQDFDLTTQCMTETPVMEFSATTPQDCVEKCALQIWCRSYNIVTSAVGIMCQLFSRSIRDCTSDPSYCPSTQPQNASCFHYNYA